MSQRETLSRRRFDVAGDKRRLTGEVKVAIHKP
jgi:hypothetical protein